MINTLRASDRKLAKELLPCMSDWYQTSFEKFQDTQLGRMNKQSGYSFYRTTSFKFYLLQNAGDHVGPAAIDIEKCSKSPNGTINLNTKGTTIILRTDSSLDRGRQTGRPPAAQLPLKNYDFDPFRDILENKLDNYCASRLAVVTWRFPEFPPNEHEDSGLIWRFNMYFSDENESVSHAKFHSGVRYVVNENDLLPTFEPFVPTEEEIQFIRDAEENKEGSAS
jgi:hypothetical protein